MIGFRVEVQCDGCRSGHGIGLVRCEVSALLRLAVELEHLRLFWGWTKQARHHLCPECTKAQRDTEESRRLSLRRMKKRLLAFRGGGSLIPSVRPSPDVWVPAAVFLPN